MNQEGEEYELRAKFIQLCAWITEIYQDGSACEPVDTEPVLLQLLHLVEAHPSKRHLFVTLFLEIANWQIPTPWYLLGFCMIQLQYQEVFEHLQSEFADGMRRMSFGRRFNYLKLNLDVFNNNDELFIRMWTYYNPTQAWEPEI
jgi:hypothetical protein